MSVECVECGSDTFTLDGSACLVGSDDVVLDAVECAVCGATYTSNRGPNRLTPPGGDDG